MNASCQGLPGCYEWCYQYEQCFMTICHQEANGEVWRTKFDQETAQMLDFSPLRTTATPTPFDVFFVLLAFLFCGLSVLLPLPRSDGGSRLWWVCLRVNTDYRHWVSDLRSPPVSGSGFVFSPSLWLGLASPQWSPCRPPLFPAAPFRRLGSLCPLPFRIVPN